MHYWRKRKEEDPVYIRYNAFKKNALKRSKDFTITLEEFRGFCERTGYILQKGKRGKNATVDRIRNWEGYHINNIQLLTNRQNVRKYYDYDRHQPPPEYYDQDPGPGPPESVESFNDLEDLPF